MTQKKKKIATNKKSKKSTTKKVVKPSSTPKVTDSMLRHRGTGVGVCHGDKPVVTAPKKNCWLGNVLSFLGFKKS